MFMSGITFSLPALFEIFQKNWTITAFAFISPLRKNNKIA